MNETVEATLFGRWLSGQRRARDLTQEDLAERLGCSLSAIQKMEGGSRRPSRQVAEILADYFAIPSDHREAFLRFARGHGEQADGPPSSTEPGFPSLGRHAVVSPYSAGSASRPNNLPIPLTSFVGRDSELPRVRDLMLTTEVRLLTLTGPPGTGKTRLALQVAEQLLRDFHGGVFFVNLAAIGDPNLVIDEIARSLGLSLSDMGGGSPFESVMEAVKDRQLLLVLDNFEQVVEAAPVVGELLVRAPGLKVLATSRVPLHIRGEKHLSVPPLHLPDPEHFPSLERLARYEAVQLFVQRAVDVDAGFELTDDNASTVAQICARLDGLPLAIELASARANVLSPQAMLSRLENSLGLLTGGQRDLPARQRTLRSAIEWSYDLLDEGEKQLFRRMGVFVGGSTLEAIEQVCSNAASAGSGIDPLEGVASLVSKSLLQRQEARGKSLASGAETGRRSQDSSEPRFTMLETIREYALERLEESGEGDPIRRRHAEFFVKFVERAAPEMWGGRVGEWLERIEQELGNLRAVMEWSLEHGSPETAAWIAGPLYRFWFVHGRSGEALVWVERILAARDQLPTAALTQVLGEAGMLIDDRGDHGRADRLLGECLSLCKELGDWAGVTLTLNRMGLAASARGDYDQAIAFWEESLALRRQLGDRPGIAQSLMNIGATLGVQGDNVKAEAMLEESRALFQDLGDEIGLGLTHRELANNALRRAEHARVESLARQSLQFSRSLGSEELAINALDLLAIAWAEQGSLEGALTLLAAVEALSEAGKQVPPSPASLRPEHSRAVSAARAQVGEEIFTSLWAQGRAMSMERAIEYALEGNEAS